jgi:hypothetical protein
MKYLSSYTTDLVQQFHRHSAIPSRLVSIENGRVRWRINLGFTRSIIHFISNVYGTGISDPLVRSGVKHVIAMRWLVSGNLESLGSLDPRGQKGCRFGGPFFIF